MPAAAPIIESRAPGLRAHLRKIDRVVPIPSHVLGLLIEWRSHCPDPSPTGLVMEIYGWRQLKTAMRYLHTTGSLSAAADRLSVARDTVYEQWSLGEGEDTAVPVEPGGDPPRAGGVLATSVERT